METIEFAAGLDHLAQPALSIVRVYKGTSLFDMLEPTPEEARALVSQEHAMLQPKFTDEHVFYGDVFSKEKVPLRGEDIESLRWEWMRSVVRNPARIANGHRVVEKLFDGEEILEFYRNVYDSPDFDQESLNRMLKTHE